METRFKSALNRITASDDLKETTRAYVSGTLASNIAPVRKSQKSLFARRAVAAACALLLVSSISGGAYAYYKTPVSYLSLDINPSVELGVNGFGNVVSATAYNNDGRAILAGQDVKGSSVKEAVSKLVQSAAQKGFVADDGSTVIAVTSETDNGSTAAHLEDAAAQGADDAVKAEGDTASVQKENVALERRDEARKLGITPGKLNLIEKLQALDPTITVDQYKDAKVTDIMKKFVTLKKQTLPQNNSSSSASSADSDASAPASAPESTDETSSTAQPKAAASSKTNNGANGASKKAAVDSSASTAGTGSPAVSSAEESTVPSATASSDTSKYNHGQSVAAEHAKNGNKK